jgi:SAM-dependent methyltransferase
MSVLEGSEAEAGDATPSPPGSNVGEGGHRPPPNLWVDAEHALAYLRRRDTIPHRVDALDVVVELLPQRVERVLDLGCGSGDLLALVLAARPHASGVGLDFGDEMLRQARERFAHDARVAIRHHDLDEPLPDELGTFDVVVSSFAIHHLDPRRQRALYGEIFEHLRPGGVFVNAEHVASPTAELHVEWLAALGSSPEHDDPSNQLVPVTDHLEWLVTCGFANSDCFWKWRELAVVSGSKPGEKRNLAGDAT